MASGSVSTKTIGLIGGMSWESSAEYYRIINQETKRVLGGQHNAKSVMVTVDFAEIEALQHQSKWDELGQLMCRAALQLQNSGADFIVLCTNTMHKLASDIEARTNIPFLHIADATAEKIRETGLKTIGLLGTRFTMEQEFYKGRLESKFGLKVLTPPEKDRKKVHDIIYEELCHGIIRDDARTDYVEIISALKDEGAEAIILGCTEITLLLKPEHSCLPVFDTTVIHAVSAVHKALERG